MADGHAYESEAALPSATYVLLGPKMICGKCLRISRRPLTAETRVRSWVSPCGICGGQSGTGIDFTHSIRFSPVNFIPPVLNYKEKRKTLIIFITGLHSKPQGCGASVASAAGLFTIKEKTSKSMKMLLR
jgi:hypothetical protein